MIGSVLIYDDWHIYYIFTFIFIGPGIITLPVLATTPQATRDQQFVIRWLVMGSEVRAADLNANKEVELDKDAKTNCDNFCYCMMRDVKTTKHCHFHTCACWCAYVRVQACDVCECVSSDVNMWLSVWKCVHAHLVLHVWTAVRACWYMTGGIYAFT